MQGVEIRPVPGAHPLYGSKFACALYATKTFHTGHTLGAYAGCIGESPSPDPPRVRRGAPCHEGQFTINLDMAQSMGRAMSMEIDAKLVGNESRFINDYRGIAPQPNVEFCTKACARKGIWVDVRVATAIGQGDEILVDYGKEFEAFEVNGSGED